ncbi:MAG: aldo/keto reductase, partial [bacterium]
NFFDTAHCYCFWREGGLGASERALGDCLRHFGGRDEVVIATKGGHPDSGPDYRRPDDYLAPELLVSDIDDSLARLGVDTIDLYWLHRDDPRRPVADIIGVLNVEIQRGRLRAQGASNWSVARIAEANEYAAAHGLHGFTASQPQWNLAHSTAQPGPEPTLRFLSPDDRRWHTASQVPVVPYNSTAGGYFATDRQDGALANPISQARRQRARTLAAQLGCTPNQVALAYLRHQPFPVVPILGTSNLDHLHDAFGACGVHLQPEQVRWLEEGDGGQE